MARLRARRRIAPGLLAAALVLAQPLPVLAQSMTHWEAPIVEASARFGIPADWIRRVIRAESGGRTTLNGRPIRSRAGAMGLMQLMPGTWQAMRHRHGLGSDPDHPRDNILAGTAYLRAMYDRFGYPGLFAAYNAGPGRYIEHLEQGRRLPAETLAYVARVSGRHPRHAARIPRAGTLDPMGGPLGMEGSRDGRGRAARGADAAVVPTIFFPLGDVGRDR